AYITEFIIKNTVDASLESRFIDLVEEHMATAKGTAKSTLKDPRAFDSLALNKPQRNSLTKFWVEWQEILGSFSILDPACGSGAFLIAAFDRLYRAYEESNEMLFELT